MQEYSYNDFLNTINESGQFVLTEISEHINLNYPQYNPFDIKPMEKSEKEWRIHYRKKPKVGKAVCTVYSFEGKLSVRFTFLSSMTHVLLKQNQFSDKSKNTALKQIVCAVNKSCRNYGGNNICEWRQFYWVNNRLIITCHLKFYNGVTAVSIPNSSFFDSTKQFRAYFLIIRALFLYS